MWGTQLQPEKFVEDYALSKQVVAVRKYGPVIEGPEIMLENERITLHETEDRLKERRQLYRKMRGVLDASWESIAHEGRNLKNNFSAFNQFIVVNNEKRKRAAENSELHKKFIREKEDGIKKYKEKIDLVQMIIGELNEQINDHKIYEKYLYRVLEQVERDEGFRNLDSFVERFEYYVELGLKFAKKQSDVFDILQHAKTELTRYEEVQRNIIMGLHTQAACLQGRFEETSRRTRRMEILISRVKDKAHENYFDAEIAKVSIWNLYLLMCKKKNIFPTIEKKDFENQLIFVGRTLKQYETLNEQLQQLAKPAKKSLKIK